MAEVLAVDSTLCTDRTFNVGVTRVLSDLGLDLGLEVNVIPAEELSNPGIIARINASHSVFVAPVPFEYPANWAQKLQKLLAPLLPKIEVPMLGSCLGHQALGVAFGATLLENVEREEGVCTVDILRKPKANPLLKDLSDRLRIANLHWASLAFEPETAPQLEQLGRSLPEPGISPNGCRNQIIGVVGRLIWGVQGHLDETEDGKCILHNFLDVPSVYLPHAGERVNSELPLAA